MRKIKEMIFFGCNRIKPYGKFKAHRRKKKKGNIIKFRIPDANQTDDFLCTGWISRV